MLFICSTASGDAGITGYRMETGNGSLTELARTLVDHPTYLAAHPDDRTVYAANRVDGGTISAFRVADIEAGELAHLNDRSSGGEGPCYVSVDPAGEYVFAANYRGGCVAMLPVGDDGSLGNPAAVARHEGSGPVEGRQDAPHPHSVVPGPEGQFIYAPDLGTDRVVAHRVDRDRGRLPTDDDASVTLPAGSGPRHLAFGPNGDRCYVVNELDSTVSALEVGTDGSLTLRETVATLPDDADRATNACADVHVHPNGQFVFVSNRGHDSVAVFTVESGHLRRVRVESTRGENPRDFVLDPAGRFLLVENRDSGNGVVFAVDGGTGELAPTGEGFSLPKPTCACFVER